MQGVTLGTKRGLRRPLLPDGSIGFLRKVVRSWAVQGLGVYAFTELLARILLEGAFVVALWLLGWHALPIAAAWLGFHTVAWFLLYSGFGRLWILLGLSTEVTRISHFIDGMTRFAQRSRSVRAVFLRGSGARRELNEQSDIDIWLVPGRPRSAAVLRLWALRFLSVVRRVPLEADLLDTERYVPFLARLGHVTTIKGPPPDRPLSERWRRRGLLVSLSGLDGSGKTTVANRVVEALRGRGLDAVYFYGHRITYLRGGTRRSFAIAFKSFWRHAGRSLQDLQDHRSAKALFDTVTLLDYLLVLWRLAILLKPRRIVIVDRYVADVIAYLRGMGPGRLAEPVLIGMSLVPDVPILFDIAPPEALVRKREQTLAELERYAADYEELRDRLRLVPVDAREPEAEVRSKVEAMLTSELGATQVEAGRLDT